MQPTVSIITPTYNHEKYIKECIESLLAQTYGDWEQIVVDDGSTDGTVAIVESFRDSRIKLIKQPHLGIENLKQTYNTALSTAKGAFIGILEGDDYWMPDKLESQLPLFRNRSVGLVWGPVQWVHQDRRVITEAPGDITKFRGLDRQRYLQELLMGNFIPALSVLLRKEMLQEIGGFQQTPYMITVDYATWMECLLRWEADVVPEVVGCWRRHPVQMSTARQHEILQGTVNFACEFFERLPVELKAELGVDAHSIRSHWETSVALSCLHEGRKCLLRNHWKGARHEFEYSIRKGSAGVKLKSALGMLASYGHFNIEGLARMMGKERIDESQIWI